MRRQAACVHAALRHRLDCLGRVGGVWCRLESSGENGRRPGPSGEGGWRVGGVDGRSRSRWWSGEGTRRGPMRTTIRLGKTPGFSSAFSCKGDSPRRCKALTGRISKNRRTKKVTGCTAQSGRAESDALRSPAGHPKETASWELFVRGAGTGGGAEGRFPRPVCWASRAVGTRIAHPCGGHSHSGTRVAGSPAWVHAHACQKAWS
eukprot:353138-Chlamydomonas_euryale.AAC.8